MKAKFDFAFEDVNHYDVKFDASKTESFSFLEEE